MFHEPHLRRFMQRQISATDVDDAVASVHASLMSQFANPGFRNINHDWESTTTPALDRIAEFDRYVWRIAKLRRYDALRREYARRHTLKAFASLPAELPSTIAQDAALEAEEFLRVLNDILESLPLDDRSFLLELVSSPRSRPVPAAQRARAYRLRKYVARKIQTKLGLGR